MEKVDMQDDMNCKVDTAVDLTPEQDGRIMPRGVRKGKSAPCL